MLRVFLKNGVETTIADSIVNEAKNDLKSLKEKTKTLSKTEETDSRSTSLMEEDDDDEESDIDEDTKLADLQNEITLKERLVEQLEQSQKHLHALRLQYEEKLTQLQSRIAETERERDIALAAFGSQEKFEKEQLKADKVRVECEEKLKHMRSELQLQSAKKEHQQFVREQQEIQRRLARLQSEVQEMIAVVKDESVRLVMMRRVKEVAQLQKDARVREVEMRSLKQDKQKRDIVLKRKQEEVQALRRLQMMKLLNDFVFRII